MLIYADVLINAATQRTNLPLAHRHPSVPATPANGRASAVCVALSSEGLQADWALLLYLMPLAWNTQGRLPRMLCVLHNRACEVALSRLPCGND
jgi:hypothetical protein